MRVYHGDQTPLPRHYVARQKLCLRATTDYWVNALDGQPFFSLNKAVDPGLLQVLEQDIIPRLKADAPHQPTPEELQQNPLLHRFTVIFDREGYSPDFFRRMKEQRVACLSYHKFPGADWPREDFASTTVRLASGQTVPMELAKRGVLLAEKLWVRELRKLSVSGHQTAVLATDYVTEAPLLAGALFSRWSQENFFRYMREHYSLDRLVDHGLEDLAETTRVVNPAYRRLDGAVRKQVAVLGRQRAKFGALTLEGELNGKKLAEYESRKAALLEELQRLEEEGDTLKADRKQVPRHILASELPEEDRFRRLELRQERAAFARAQQIGPQMADFERTRGRFQERFANMGTEVLRILLSMWETIEPVAEKGLSSLEALVAITAVFAKTMEMKFDLATGQFAELTKDTADLGPLITKAGKELGEIFKGEEDDPLENHFLEDLMGLGTEMAIRGPGGGGGAPRRARRGGP